MLFRRRIQGLLTDSIIDLVPVYLGEVDKEYGFGEVKEWKITLHGRLREIGRISLRMGEGPGIYYFGHIGYHIDPPWRGHRYARRACELLRTELNRSGKSSVVITTDVDNITSQKTCLGIGAVLERIVDVPVVYQKRWSLSARKCRYVWKLGKEYGQI